MSERRAQRPTIRLVASAPCYCSVCDSPNAVKVRLSNPYIVQPGGFAVCEQHAEQLGNLLTNYVRRLRFKRRALPPTVPEHV